MPDLFFQGIFEDFQGQFRNIQGFVSIRILSKLCLEGGRRGYKMQNTQDPEEVWRSLSAKLATGVNSLKTRMSSCTGRYKVQSRMLKIQVIFKR